MGFEITFHYREAGEERGTFEEEVKTKKTKVGSPYDDVPVEQAAGKVMAQFARRNILVTDVEIFEYTKKKLSFREADDGIVIGRKKFKFDDGAALDVQDEAEESPQDQLAKLLAANPALAQMLQPQQQQQPSQVQVHITNPGGNADNVPRAKPVEPGGNLVPQITRAPLRHEIFDPERLLAEAAQRRGLKFRLGQEYPIYEEKMPPSGMENMGLMYITVDDAGNKQILSSMHFNPKVGTLEKGFTEEPTKTSNGLDSRLQWSGAYSDAGVPSLR